MTNTTEEDLDKKTSALLQKNVYNLIKEDREQYREIYDIIIKYSIDNKLFISDLFALTGSSGELSQLDDYHFDIYCANPLEHCNKLTNNIFKYLNNEKSALYPKLESLMMNTVLENEEFVIAFDTRFIVKMYALQRNRRSNSMTDITNIIKPTIIDKLYYMPIEVEIIDFYHKQYTMGLGEEKEKLMFDLWKKSVADIAKYDPSKNKLGGIHEDYLGGDGSTCYERKKDELEAIKIAIYKEFFRGRNDIIQLGPLAVDWIISGDNICPKYDRIQLVSTRSAEQLRDELNKYISSLDRGYKINLSSELDLLLPKDFRTKRVVFSVSIGHKEKPILEYFTSCSFELIPCSLHHGILCASRPVLMRFLLIDMWITKFIHIIGKADLDQTRKKLERTKDLIELTYETKLNIEGVLGSYVDADIEKRQLLRDSKNKQHFPYVPYNYFNKNDTLRQIGKGK